MEGTTKTLINEIEQIFKDIDDFEHDHIQKTKERVDRMIKAYESTITDLTFEHMYEQANEYQTKLDKFRLIKTQLKGIIKWTN